MTPTFLRKEFQFCFSKTTFFLFSIYTKTTCIIEHKSSMYPNKSVIFLYCVMNQTLINNLIYKPFLQTLILSLLPINDEEEIIFCMKEGNRLLYENHSSVWSGLLKQIFAEPPTCRFDVAPIFKIKHARNTFKFEINTTSFITASYALTKPVFFKGQQNAPIT